MECYTTLLSICRERRNLWHFIEPSFAFGASLSLFLLHCSLFSFPFKRVCAHLQARGLAQGTTKSAFTQLSHGPASFPKAWIKNPTLYYNTVKTPLHQHLKAALSADSSFQSKQGQLQVVAVTTR